MNAKKKLLSIGLAASLAAIAVAGSSLAYFTATDEEANEYTIGNVTIDLTEPSWEGADDLYPGEPVAKDPTIENQGANPAFVRIQLTGMEYFDYRTNYVTGALGEGWVEHNGYYYYTTPLAGTETPADEKLPIQTTALFNQVVLKSTLGNEVANVEGSIGVVAEAVQAQGARPSFAAVKEMGVEEIADWFAACGFDA